MPKWLDRILRKKGDTESSIPETPEDRAEIERTMSFEEEVVAAEFSIKQGTGYYLPVREEQQYQQSAWEALGVTPPVGEYNWIKTYSNEHGQGYELIRRKVGQFNRVVMRTLHVGDDPTKKTHEEGWF